MCSVIFFYNEELAIVRVLKVLPANSVAAFASRIVSIPFSPVRSERRWERALPNVK